MRLLFHLYRAMLRSSVVDTLDCIFGHLSQNPEHRAQVAELFCYVEDVPFVVEVPLVVVRE